MENYFYQLSFYGRPTFAIMMRLKITKNKLKIKTAGITFIIITRSYCLKKYLLLFTVKNKCVFVLLP